MNAPPLDLSALPASAQQRRAALVVLAALGAVALPARAEVPIPPLTGPVVDTAGLLDARSRSALEDLSRAAGEAGPAAHGAFAHERH